MEINRVAIRYSTLFALAAIPFANDVWAVDAAAAESLVKASMCLTCHAVDQKKTGPSYHEIAAKHKGQKDAVAKISHHITSAPMVKMANGAQMKHMVIKSTDPEQVKNVAEWILSR